MAEIAPGGGSYSAGGQIRDRIANQIGRVQESTGEQLSRAGRWLGIIQEVPLEQTDPDYPHFVETQIHVKGSTNFEGVDSEAWLRGVVNRLNNNIAKPLPGETPEAQPPVDQSSQLRKNLLKLSGGIGWMAGSTALGFGARYIFGATPLGSGLVGLGRGAISAGRQLHEGDLAGAMTTDTNFRKGKGLKETAINAAKFTSQGLETKGGQALVTALSEKLPQLLSAKSRDGNEFLDNVLNRLGSVDPEKAIDDELEAWEKDEPDLTIEDASYYLTLAARQLSRDQFLGYQRELKGVPQEEITKKVEAITSLQKKFIALAEGSITVLLEDSPDNKDFAHGMIQMLAEGNRSEVNKWMLRGTYVGGRALVGSLKGLLGFELAAAVRGEVHVDFSGLSQSWHDMTGNVTRATQELQKGAEQFKHDHWFSWNKDDVLARTGRTDPNLIRPAISPASPTEVAGQNPSLTPTLEPSHAATAMPSASHTLTPTSTETGTATGTATLTPEPSSTPTVLPSATHAPTGTSTPGFSRPSEVPTSTATVSATPGITEHPTVLPTAMNTSTLTPESVHTATVPIVANSPVPGETPATINVPGPVATPDHHINIPLVGHHEPGDVTSGINPSTQPLGTIPGINPDEIHLHPETTISIEIHPGETAGDLVHQTIPDQTLWGQEGAKVWGGLLRAKLLLDPTSSNFGENVGEWQQFWIQSFKIASSTGAINLDHGESLRAFTEFSEFTNLSTDQLHQLTESAILGNAGAINTLQEHFTGEMWGPGTVDKLNSLIDKAQAGDPDSIRKLQALWHWIPAGAKLKVPSKLLQLVSK